MEVVEEAAEVPEWVMDPVEESPLLSVPLGRMPHHPGDRPEPGRRQAKCCMHRDLRPAVHSIEDKL